jgi:exodeoxyribonuclease VII large subunit
MDELRHLASRLKGSWARAFEKAAAVLARLDANLKHLNPQSVLERGYSITQDRGGRIVRDAVQLAVGDDLRITLSKGWAEASVARKGNADAIDRER